MGFLQRLFSGGSGRRIQHPVLGEALLMRARGGAWWEVETELEGHAFSVSIDAPDEADPSPAQVAFFQRHASDPDGAFARARPLLVPEYERWLRQPFPDDWRSAFRFVAMTVPLAGDEQRPWELSFECLGDRAGHHFTCLFEQGRPATVQVDG